MRGKNLGSEFFARSLLLFLKDISLIAKPRNARFCAERGRGFPLIIFKSIAVFLLIAKCDFGFREMTVHGGGAGLIQMNKTRHSKRFWAF